MNNAIASQIHSWIAEFRGLAAIRGYHKRPDLGLRAIARPKSASLQLGTTPLVKLVGSKATRGFTNFPQAAITDSDDLGPRAIIDGRFNLVIPETKYNNVQRERFDLEADAAEKTNHFDLQPALAEKLQARLRDERQSVLSSLSGADYGK